MCKSFLHFGDPELRPSIALFHLQGPAHLREKQEKERTELRDLVIFLIIVRTLHRLLQEIIPFSCIADPGRKESPCSQSDRGCGP